MPRLFQLLTTSTHSRHKHRLVYVCKATTRSGRVNQTAATGTPPRCRRCKVEKSLEVRLLAEAFFMAFH